MGRWGSRRRWWPCRLWLALCNWTPPNFFARFQRFWVLKFLRRFQLFQLFQLFDIATAVAYCLLLAHLFFNRPSLVASYAPSDAPEPLFTSDFHRRCRKHRCRQILTFGEGILASWNSAAAPAPFPPTTLSPLATTGYAASYWLMEFGW